MLNFFLNDFFFKLLTFYIFLKKKAKKKNENTSLKNTISNMANKTFRKPHSSTKDATGMCSVYTTQREITP